MNFLSTFTGIGGFDLGLERANWRCAGQVEIEPYCNAVLQKHWPNVWRHDDVKTLTGELVRTNCGLLDALVGGPPCQPSSVAGERRGAADDRWLWPDFLRLVSEINDAQERPLLWLLAENPRGVTSIRVEGLQFADWLAREFEARGYDLLPIELAAEDVGAPHRRERVWFVALANGRHDQSRQRDGRVRQLQPAGDGHVAITTSDGRREGRAESAREQGRSNALVGREELANAPGGGESGLPGGANARIANTGIGREDVANPVGLADSDTPRLQEYSRERDDARRELAAIVRNGWPARPGESQYEWEEPRVLFDRRDYFKVSLRDEDTGSGRGLTGVAGCIRRAFKSALGLPIDGPARRLAGRRRVAALQALGNAVVPQVAQVLGEMINRFEEDHQ